MQSDVPDVLQDMRTITRETAGATRSCRGRYSTVVAVHGCLGDKVQGFSLWQKKKGNGGAIALFFGDLIQYSSAGGGNA